MRAALRLKPPANGRICPRLRLPLGKIGRASARAAGEEGPLPESTLLPPLQDSPGASLKWAMRAPIGAFGAHTLTDGFLYHAPLQLAGEETTPAMRPGSLADLHVPP